MEIVKLSQPDEINVLDIPQGTAFELHGEKYIRTATASTVIVGDEVLKDVVAANLENGYYLYLKDSSVEVFAVPLHSAKIVVE